MTMNKFIQWLEIVVQILVIIFGIMGMVTIGELLIASAINLYVFEVRMMYTHGQWLDRIRGREGRKKQVQKFSSCDGCKYIGKAWDEEPCDDCTFGGDENHFEPKEGVKS